MPSDNSVDGSIRKGVPKLRACGQSRQRLLVRRQLAARDALDPGNHRLPVGPDRARKLRVDVVALARLDRKLELSVRPAKTLTRRRLHNNGPLARFDLDDPIGVVAL